MFPAKKTMFSSLATIGDTALTNKMDTGHVTQSLPMRWTSGHVTQL